MITGVTYAFQIYAPLRLLYRFSPEVAASSDDSSLNTYCSIRSFLITALTALCTILHSRVQRSDERKYI